MYNILLVDDEPEILNFLGKLCASITEYPLKVHKALSGKGALDILGKTGIDVTVSDMRMPGMNGLDLSKAIQERSPGCRIIFLSGYRDFDAVYGAIQMEHIRYLMKTEGDGVIRQAIIDAIREQKSQSTPERAETLNIQGKPQYNKTIQILRSYIASHIGEDLSLAALSDLVYRDVSYISWLFKQEMGIKLSTYILQHRMEAAKAMLLSTNMKIQEIAAAVGYQSGHSFSRLFRRVTGMSPQEYRCSGN